MYQADQILNKVVYESKHKPICNLCYRSESRFQLFRNQQCGHKYCGECVVKEHIPDQEQAKCLTKGCYQYYNVNELDEFFTAENIRLFDNEQNQQVIPENQTNFNQIESDNIPDQRNHIPDPQNYSFQQKSNQDQLRRKVDQQKIKLVSVNDQSPEKVARKEEGVPSLMGIYKVQPPSEVNVSFNDTLQLCYQCLFRIEIPEFTKKSNTCKRFDHKICYSCRWRRPLSYCELCDRWDSPY